jgi:hypothetical protein
MPTTFDMHKMPSMHSGEMLDVFHTHHDGIFNAQDHPTELLGTSKFLRGG